MFMTITQRIFEIMDSKHISQITLSEYTGISTSAISAWRRKNAYPTAEKIPKIAECLGVSISELYNITDESEIEVQSTNPFGSELVWKTYLTLTEKEKLEVAVFILGKGEAH